MSKTQFYLPPVFKCPSPFSSSLQTSSEQLNAIPSARIGVSWHKGPVDVAGWYSDVDENEGKAAGDIRSFLCCGDRKVCSAEDADLSCTSRKVEVFYFCWLGPMSARVKFAVSGKVLGGPQSGRCARTRKATVRADCRRKTGRQRQSQVPHTAVRPERRDATRWLAQPETPHRSDFSECVW